MHCANIQIVAAVLKEQRAHDKIGVLSGCRAVSRGASLHLVHRTRYDQSGRQELGRKSQRYLNGARAESGGSLSNSAVDTWSHAVWC